MTLEETLVRAALTAGAYIRERALAYGQLDWKGKDDPVTELDKAGERIIREIAAPANFLGEEYGLKDNGAEYTWIIDPIDGTKSFIRGEFLSATSIGIEKDGKLVAGAVYDFMRDLLFVGVGDTAYLQQNGKKYTIQKPQMTAKVYVATSGLTAEETAKLEGVGYSLRERSGSIALSLAQLANGVVEAIVSRPEPGKGNPWDVAGGVAVLRGSGYQVLSHDFEQYNHRGDKGMIAARPEMVDALREVLKQ